MFPDGLRFRPARVTDGKRQIWEIEGDARFNGLGEDRFRSDHDPGRSKLAGIETANGADLELVERDSTSQPDEKARIRATRRADDRANKRNQTSRFRMNRDPNGIRIPEPPSSKAQPSRVPATITRGLAALVSGPVRLRPAVSSYVWQPRGSEISTSITLTELLAGQ